MKKLYQNGWDRINEIAQKRAKDSQMENKLIKNILKIIIICCLVIVPIVPLFVTEQFVSDCGLCQDLVSFMSSVIPGIKVMAGSTKIPQIVSLEVALAWVAIIALTIAMLSIFFINKNFDSDIFGTGKLFVFMYFGLAFFLAGEFGFIASHVSFFHGTVGLFHEDSRRHLTHYLIQSKTGLSFFSFMTIFALTSMIFCFVLMNISLIVKFFKRSIGVR